MITVIEDKNNWKKLVSSFKNYDFYHTYDYHFISKKSDETPILIYFEDGNQKIAIPFLKRKIEESSYWDLTSVYGYCGPIFENLGDDYDNSTFKEEFNYLLRQLDIISVFSRLHPLIENQFSILNELGEVSDHGKVVTIDLTKDLDEQRREFGKSTKNRINKARRLCTVKKALTKDEINSFIDIYYENMDRLEAKNDYYFSRQYFHNFLECTDFDVDILLVTHNDYGYPIAGSMFIKTNDLIQFHLSGSKTDFLKIAPANLFIDEMRILATEQGFNSFNLGGGLGGQMDSLYNFKASFSKQNLDFKLWKYIVNHEAYNELVTLKKLDVSNGSEEFFPLYRFKI